MEINLNKVIVVALLSLHCSIGHCMTISVNICLNISGWLMIVQIQSVLLMKLQFAFEPRQIIKHAQFLSENWNNNFVMLLLLCFFTLLTSKFKVLSEQSTIISTNAVPDQIGQHQQTFQPSVIGGLVWN